MVAIDINGTITQYNAIPSVWPPPPENGVVNYNSVNNTTQQISDGWRDVVQPVIDTATQKRGDIYFDAGNDNYTYAVIDLTDQEIQDRKTSQAENDQVTTIQKVLADDVMGKAQDLDDKDASINQPLYSLWDSFDNGFTFVLDYKLQDFVNNDLALFRCIQENPKQVANRPNGAPALWTKIEYINGIEIWSQPIGGDNKYPYIDPLTGEQYLVYHLDQIWQNIHVDDFNIWIPGEFGWQLIP